MIDQVPAAPTTPLPTTVLPSSKVTVSPTAPVPVMTGLVMLVMSSPCTPLSLPVAKARLAGGMGAVVAIVTVSGLETPETLPATSFSVAVRLCAPAASVLLFTDQVPSEATVAVPRTVVPSYKVTVSPPVPVPVMVGVVTLVTASPLLPLSLAAASASEPGVAGVAVSISRPSGSDAAEMLPATSVCVAVRSCMPAASGPVAIDQLPSAPTVSGSDYRAAPRPKQPH